MLPKKGRKLPAWEGALASRQAFAETIANLLRKEHGDTHRAVKQLMRLTNACQTAFKRDPRSASKRDPFSDMMLVC